MAGKRGKGKIYGGFVIPSVRDDAPKSHLIAVINVLKGFKVSQEASLIFYEQNNDAQAVRVTTSKIKSLDEGIAYYTKLLNQSKE